MDYEQYKKIVLDYKSIGGEVINFTPYAGEVFTDSNFISKVNFAYNLGFDELNTYTNATLIHKFGADSILKSGLTSIAISTSPLDQALYKKIFRSGQYKKMLENLLSLLQSFHEAKWKTVKSIRIEFRSDRPLSMIKELPDYRLVEPFVRGSVTESALTTFDSWMGVINPSNLLPGMKLKNPNMDKDVPCDRLYMLKITSNGKYRACGCRYNYSSDVDNFYIGRTQVMRIQEAYESKKLYELKQDFRNGNPPPECKNCSWYEAHRYHGQ